MNRCRGRARSGAGPSPGSSRRAPAHRVRAVHCRPAVHTPGVAQGGLALAFRRRQGTTSIAPVTRSTIALSGGLSRPGRPLVRTLVPVPWPDLQDARVRSRNGNTPSVILKRALYSRTDGGASSKASPAAAIAWRKRPATFPCPVRFDAVAGCLILMYMVIVCAVAGAVVPRATSGNPLVR